MKPTFINIHVQSLLHTDWFGTDSFTLPYSEELENAILLINLECAKVKKKQKDDMRDEYLARKYHELRDNIDNGRKCRDILRDIAEYESRNK